MARTQDRATFGTIRSREELLPHPTEAAICQKAYNLFLDHRRKKTVARLLNEAGCRTRSGGQFSDTSVGRMLRDPALRDTGVIPVEVWEGVQAVLAEATSSTPVRRNVRHLLSGLVHCGCGELMYPKPPLGKYTCRCCRRKIPADDLDAVVAHTLEKEAPSDLKLPPEWQGLPLEGKRRLIELMVDRIVVGATIEVHLAL